MGGFFRRRAGGFCAGRCLERDFRRQRCGQLYCGCRRDSRLVDLEQQLLRSFQSRGFDPYPKWECPNFSLAVNFSMGTGSLVFNDTNSTWATGGQNYTNVTVNGGVTIASTATITGSFILGNTGSLSGQGPLLIQDNAVLGSTGALTAPVLFQLATQNGVMPARIYGSSVTVQNTSASPLSMVIGSGNAQIFSRLNIWTTNAGGITFGWVHQ